jgi:hypothetical protein
MEQIPSWEANRFVASQEIPHPNITLIISTFNAFCSLHTINTEARTHLARREFLCILATVLQSDLFFPSFHLTINPSSLNHYVVALSTHDNDSGCSTFSSSSYPTLQKPHLLVRLVWKVAILFTRELVWLIGKRSPLSLTNKILIYKVVLKPIGRMDLQYGAELQPPT